MEREAEWSKHGWVDQERQRHSAGVQPVQKVQSEERPQSAHSRKALFHAEECHGPSTGVKRTGAGFLLALSSASVTAEEETDL